MKISIRRILLIVVLILSCGIMQAAKIKHSLSQWSFRFPLQELCKGAKPLGVVSIELVGPEKWDLIKSYGYDIAIADGADLGVERGFCNPDFHEELIRRYKELIPLAAKNGIRKIICYSGLNTTFSSEEALENCVRGLQPLMRTAEKNNVVLVMELFSSNEGKEEYFKHSYPHYACDNVKWGVDLCKKLNSKNFRLLYDIWQMYDMKADVLSDIRNYHDYIAHYHIAGIEGRKALSDNEPIDFKEIMRTIYSYGYDGYIGHEYLIEKEVFPHIQKSIEILEFDTRSTSRIFNNWGDALNFYVMDNYMPAEKYKWNWREATYLRALADRYELGLEDKDQALAYIKTAMDKSMNIAFGTNPNAIASAFGMAFLARVTNEDSYKQKANELYQQYLKIPRTSNGGVSHRENTLELWDDTVYMISLFLNEMYLMTGDKAYLKEMASQLLLHAEKLQDPKTGLWYHGWDNDRIVNDDKCCMFGWGDNEQQRNNEFWSRGNGWVAMTLVNTLHYMPRDMAERKPLERLFIKMMDTLKECQDRETGHWYQLPLYLGEKGNFIESSGTAMFAYAMCRGIEDGILQAKKIIPAVTSAYKNFEKLSIKDKAAYRTVANVCAGTCIGDKMYYYKRNVVDDTHYALGAAIMFAQSYQCLLK